MLLRVFLGSHTECKYALMSFGIPTGAFPIGFDDQCHAEHHKKWIETQRQKDQLKFSLDDIPGIANVFQNDLDLLDAGMNLRVGLASPGQNSTTSSAPSSGHGIMFETPEELVSSSTEVLTLSETTTTGNGIESMPMDILLGRGKPLQRHPGNVEFRKLIAAQADNYEKGDRFEKTLIAADVVATIRESQGRFLKPLKGGGWEEIDDATARLKVAHTFRTLRKSKKKAAGW